jgi:hypothetical protein
VVIVAAAGVHLCTASNAIGGLQQVLEVFVVLAFYCYNVISCKAVARQEALLRGAEACCW